MRVEETSEIRLKEPRNAIESKAAGANRETEKEPRSNHHTPLHHSRWKRQEQAKWQPLPALVMAMGQLVNWNLNLNLSFQLMRYQQHQQQQKQKQSFRPKLAQTRPHPQSRTRTRSNWHLYRTRHRLQAQTRLQTSTRLPAQTPQPSTTPTQCLADLTLPDVRAGRPT